MLATECDDQLLVCFLFTRLVQDAHMSLTTIERFGGLTQSACEPVVDQRNLQYAFECIQHRHVAGLAGGVGGNFNLVGRGHLLGLRGLFSVRLWVRKALVEFNVCRFDRDVSRERCSLTQGLILDATIKARVITFTFVGPGGWDNGGLERGLTILNACGVCFFNICQSSSKSAIVGERKGVFD